MSNHLFNIRFHTNGYNFYFWMPFSENAKNLVCKCLTEFLGTPSKSSITSEKFSNRAKTLLACDLETSCSLGIFCEAHWNMCFRETSRVFVILKSFVNLARGMLGAQFNTHLDRCAFKKISSSNILE